ncbi:MAG: hypothetical protein ACYDCJ_12365 [Gammaproteobacteria bacterium]
MTDTTTESLARLKADANLLFVSRTIAAERTGPGTKDTRERENARMHMTDLLRKVWRDGFTTEQLAAAFDEMIELRGRKIKEYEYYRVIGYLPPSPVSE